MRGVAIYRTMKTFWKRPKNQPIISRIIDRDLKDSSQGNNKKTSSQDLVSFKRTDYGMDIGRIDWG